MTNPLQVLLFAASLPLAAPDSNTKGRFLLHDPGVGQNGVACVSCHALVEEESTQADGLIRSGHSLWGVAQRSYWRGDQRRAEHRQLGSAINVCVQLFQGGTTLEPTDLKNLVVYLTEISPKKGQGPLAIQPALEANLEYNRDKYLGGDADRGRDLFFKACNGCHPRGKSGLGPALSGEKVAEVAQKVREGNGLLRGKREPGDWMPFFGRDRLSDSQVADIAAYVATLAAED